MGQQGARCMAGSGKQHALGVEEENTFDIREYETSINIFSALEIAVQINHM